MCMEKKKVCKSLLAVTTELMVKVVYKVTYLDIEKVVVRNTGFSQDCRDSRSNGIV